jgi:aspartate carbamoyltransferase catalytic subunit
MRNARSLLGIEDLTTGEIQSLLKLAGRMDPKRPQPLLRNRRIVLLFYEASTRTRVSFELAAKSLGAMTALVQASGSSIEKGESLIDTGYTLESEHADAIVIRHPAAGAAHLLARHLKISIINAGDGMHEHPTQALLDARTILQHKKKLRGLKVAIVGDILHSRVARSNALLLSRFGARVCLCGPKELAPDVAASLAPGVTLSHNLPEALKDADVVMALRIQKERLAGMQFPLEQYVAEFQITSERLRWAKRDAVLMHPGPIIRGLDLSGEAADGGQSVILEQVSNGLAVRMAVLAWALGAA